VTIVINNAGIATGATGLNHDDLAAHRDEFEVNYFGTLTTFPASRTPRCCRCSKGRRAARTSVLVVTTG
jgi:short-subunit dehydrogenase